MKISLLVTLVLITFEVAYSEEKAKYEEKCTITTGSGISVDSCDASKFLSCTSGYCRCNDPATQLYDYNYAESNSRSKRSPKKGSKGGGFKKGTLIKDTLNQINELIGKLRLYYILICHLRCGCWSNCRWSWWSLLRLSSRKGCG